MSATSPLRLGITVMPEWFQCEGIEAVLDRLQAAGASALATSPYLLELAPDGQGAREPPPDGDAGSVRPLDRALWGRREAWVRTAPSFEHDLARYRGLRYQPSPPGALTHAQPRLIDDVVDAARRRGMDVYLQVMAASPPGYRVQFSSAVDDDACLGPDGRPHPQRVDRNASLHSPHVLDYGAALLAELAERYPSVTGFRIDWPEYPPYDLRSVLFDFNPHGDVAWQRLGVDRAEFGRSVVDRLSGWRQAVLAATPRGPRQVAVALRHSGWETFFHEHGAGAPLWASKRAAVGAMLRRYRAALDAVPGARRRLEPQVFPTPFTQWSGFDWSAATDTADAIGVKLYTMHWPMIARYWARDLVGDSDPAALDVVTIAIAGFLKLVDHEPSDGATLRYPAPDVPHPVGVEAQRGKLFDARSLAGRVPIVPFAHSYGRIDDVIQRLALASDDSTGTVWINRYGYLSDEKLAAVARLMAARRRTP